VEFSDAVNTRNATNDDQATQKAFADSARDFLGRVDHRARVRRLGHAEPAFERENWRALAEAGWLSMLVPPDEGGLGLGIGVAAAVAQAAGEYLLPEPFVAAGIQSALVLGGTPPGAARSELLSALRDGSLIIANAWQESAGQLDPKPGATRMHRSGAQWTMSGTKRFVEPGAGADGWLVLADRSGEAALVWVPKHAPGTALKRERRVDGSLWATLELDRVSISAHDVLAIGVAASVAVAEATDGARLVQAAELVGVGCRALDITLDYVKTRTQFGKPIGSFQALQHRLVDAKIQLELASASVDEAQRESRDHERLAELASRAKARAALAALGATRLAIQLHGAIGNTEACDIGLYFKRALALNASLGTAMQHRRRYLTHARRLQGRTGCAVPLPAESADWEELSDTQVRHIVRTFLETHYPKHLRHMPRCLHWNEARDWCLTLYQRGWTAPAWPKACGGMGLSASKMMAVHEEMQNFGVARWIDLGVEMLGPLLIVFGTAQQRHTYLPRILSREHLWCQGYSEPNAGSDLASLKTTAELVGERFRVNGRKIWTSYAQEATHIFLLVRTEKSAKQSAGISFLLVDLKTPGISLTPIEDLRSDPVFCEIVFDDVQVPIANLVGELNQGWAIAKALLGYERLFIANPAPVTYTMTLLRSLAQHRGLYDDAAFCERCAELELDLADLNALYNRFADILRRGEPVTHDISMLKIFSTETWQRAAAFLAEAADEQGACVDGQQVGGEDLQMLSPTFNALPSSIYGGSNEIQRNVAARQVLGLPE
jgi:alkylation response protein AidB-like acyl-CoA dehydrogenase